MKTLQLYFTTVLQIHTFKLPQASDIGISNVLAAVLGHVKGKTSHLRLSYKSAKKAAAGKQELNFELAKFNFSN